MNSVGDQFSTSDAIAPQFIRYDLPRLTTVTFQQAPEEPLRSDSIPAGLKKNIDNLTILSTARHR